MPLSEETRRRTWKPKSRSGCKTCKIRRVKCDEAKPFCKRCIKFGTVCDGYDSGFQARAPERKGPLAILPKVNSLALTVPSTSMFNDQQDFFYFSHFQKSTAPELAGPFDASIWSRVVLQACQSDQSVYRLTTALAALNKASMLEGSHFITEAESHRKYAIRNYGQALKGVQKMISEMPRPDTARLALIASLLIFCFESAFGQMDSAIKTIESSLPIMRKELSRARQTYRHLNTVSPTPALEDDLVAAFVRVENAVISVPRVSTAGIRPKVLDVVYIEDLRNIPYQFHNLRVARNYLENFQYWALSGLASEFESQINKFDSNMQGRETSKIVASQLEQWMAAFEPLYAASCIASNPDRIAATSLRALCLSTKIAAQRLFLPTEPFVYESREIIDLSRVVVEDEGFRRVFVCECVIVPALFIVVTNCLDFTLRKEALQLLWSTVPRCEGTWDSLKLARMGESLLAAES